MKFYSALVSIILTLGFFFTVAQDTHAISKFSTTYNVYYTVNPNGSTHVIFNITQKNNLSVVYAIEYSLSVNQTRIQNVKVIDENVYLNPEIIKSKNQTAINFSFANKIVGKDKDHRFTIEYDTEDIATKFGNTWQINIPKLEVDENIVDQNIILTVPNTFPQPAYVSPNPTTANANVYYFSGNTISNKTVSAVFGQSQYFRANLSYHLQNDDNITVKQKVALPPATSYQKIYLEKIQPEPLSITTDEDGNLLAEYQLDSHTSLDITVSEVIKLNFNPEHQELSDPRKYLSNNKIWDYESDLFTIPEMKSLITPKSIYDFVSDKLNYDYQKIYQPKNTVSASESYKNAASAICTDFSNLFVTLARKANIPAREIQGYAFSENPDLKPISLTQDVLHSWPEYYDQTRQTWIQVDPTWAKTTHGVDYFNKLDLNHIAFVIHGSDINYPVPAGGYKKNTDKEKNVNITPIDEIDFPNPKISLINIETKDQKLVAIIKNITGVSYQGTIQVLDSPYYDHQTQKTTLGPLNQTKIYFDLKNNPLLIPKSIKAIIYLNGEPVETSIVLNPQIPTAVLLASGSVFLGCLTLIARYLYLRRRP